MHMSNPLRWYSLNNDSSDIRAANSAIKSESTQRNVVAARHDILTEGSIDKHCDTSPHVAALVSISPCTMAHLRATHPLDRAAISSTRATVSSNFHSNHW